MKAVKTRYDENRLKGLHAVGSFSLLSTGSKNFLQSVNTDIIQAKAGFNAKVVRRTEPNCCSWCASLAGTNTPEETKAKGIYARHEGCVCTIDFYPSKGKRQRISNYMKDAKTQEKLAAASGREERIALAKERESGIINYARAIDSLFYADDYEYETYTKEEIFKNLQSSPVGLDAIRYLRDNSQIKVKLSEDREHSERG